MYTCTCWLGPESNNKKTHGLLIHERPMIGVHGLTNLTCRRHVCNARFLFHQKSQQAAVSSPPIPPQKKQHITYSYMLEPCLKIICLLILDIILYRFYSKSFSLPIHRLCYYFCRCLQLPSATPSALGDTRTTASCSQPATAGNAWNIPTILAASNKAKISKIKQE